MGSENVAKLIAILATFSRTGHNWAALDFSGIADLAGLTRTGHYQPDGTFTDWQSRVKSVSRSPFQFNDSDIWCCEYGRGGTAFSVDRSTTGDHRMDAVDDFVDGRPRGRT